MTVETFPILPADYDPPWDFPVWLVLDGLSDFEVCDFRRVAVLEIRRIGPTPALHRELIVVCTATAPSAESHAPHPQTAGAAG